MSDGIAAGEDRNPSSLQRVDHDAKGMRKLHSEPARPVVVVLGMHRSGTSLLSNVLHSLGVDMADTTDHVSPKNAGGFWERPSLVEIHDEILAVIDRPISKPSHVLPFPPAWWRRKHVQALKPKLVDYVREELARSPNPWGFKDPRTCRLLPLWWEVFRELNVEPVYVHAIRRPAESSLSMAQKSSARKLSFATSELMWLSYNYDVARYVTSKEPTILVDYDQWFEDAPEVARKLEDSLCIADDLTGDELVEFVEETVRGEYRHHVEGKDDLVCDLPLADMLYRCLRESESDSNSDQRQLRGQLRVIDMFFKSVRPIMADLDAAAANDCEREQLSESEAAAKQSLADAEARIAQLSESEAAAKQSLADAEARIAQLSESEAAAKQSLADAETRIAQLQDEHQRAIDELAAARDAASEADKQARDSVAELQEERRRTIEEIAAARDAVSVAEKRARDSNAIADEWSQERDLARGEAASAREERDKEHAARQQAEAELESRNKELTTVSKRLATAEERNRRVAAQLEALELELQQAEAELESRNKELTTVSKRLATAEERNRRVAAQLEALELELSEAQAVSAGREMAASVFAWPADTDGAAVEGAVESNEQGIRGAVLFSDRPEIVPVVEVRVGGKLVAAQFCARDGTGAAAAQAPWPFTIPWSRISQEHAGKRATVRVAGADREIGRARIPADLHEYHLSPAAVASKLLGGTIGEASEYHRWIRECESHRDVELAQAYYADARTDWPTISVVVYGGDESAIASTMQSLREQVYRDWEAICVGCSPSVEEEDPRVRAVASDEVEQFLNKCDEQALFSFVEAGDTLSPTALLHLAVAARETPEFSLIYSDEDRIDPRLGVRGLPHMKGEWSPDLGLTLDYVSRLALVRRKCIVEVSDVSPAAVYSVVLRAALSGAGPVTHLPFVLYHRSASNVREEDDLATAVESIVRESPATTAASVVRLGNARWKIEWSLPDPPPRISLVVPTRDRLDLLKVCVDGFINGTNYDNLEVLIADNDSEEEETKSYLAKVATHPRIRVIPCPGAFNFSRVNNLAVQHAVGSVIGLMNNDLKVVDPDWLRHMAPHVVRPDIGIVGAKLLHGDDTVQHAGVTLGIGVASHLYKSFPPDAEGHYRRLVLPQDLSAVTAACMLIRREVWDKVGGLDEEFPIAYNDVDLCLKVTAHGYRVLWTPEAVVYHLESQSRGKETTPEKRERLEREKERLLERWGDRLVDDPFHSPNLSAKHIDARLAFPPRAAPPWHPLAA